MASQLSLYNAALRNIGQRQLANLGEDVETRYLLDNVWDDGLVDRVLGQGHWNFATRTVELDYEPSIEPSFGYRRAFAKPADWIKTSAISSNGFFDPPLNAFADETGFWFSDIDKVYVRYVSNDAEYGSDLGKWPQAFSVYVACYMASQMAPGPTRSQELIDRLERKAKKLLYEAKAFDGSNEGAKFFPRGSWVTSRRMGGFPSRNREQG